MALPRANLSGPSESLTSSDLYNIPVDHVVELRLNSGHRVLGTCLANPKTSFNKNVVELGQVHIYIPEKNMTREYGFRKFYSNEIVELTVKEPPKIANGNSNDEPTVVERIMITKIYDTYGNLLKMFDLMTENDISDVAVSLHGINIGRVGTLGWICLVMKGLFICIDVLSIERECDKKFWLLLEEKLFSNEKITKIVHNTRPIADFLFHVRAIKIKNVFDTQMTHLYIFAHQNRDKMPATVDVIVPKDCPYKWEFKLLWQTMEAFLTKQEYLSEEIKLLQTLEVMDFSKSNPIMQRPLKNLDDHKKFMAISVKYLHIIKDVQTKILLSHINDCVKQEILLVHRGNMADFAQFRNAGFVAHNIQEKIGEAAPYLKTDRLKDYDY